MPAILQEADEGTAAEFGTQLVLARAQNTYSFMADGIAIPRVNVERMRTETGEHHMGAVARKYLAAHPDYERKGMLRLRAVVETGFASWYPWSLENWGTTWGAYRVKVVDHLTDRFEFTFETAWAFPQPIFAKLTKDYPSLTFDLATYDEGSNFAGSGQIGPATVSPFTIGKASPELFEATYGHAPEVEEESDG